jgi:hypothetical protein
VREVESAESETRQRAAADWDSDLAVAYGQVALILAQVVRKHWRKCAVCQARETTLQAAAEAK